MHRNTLLAAGFAAFGLVLAGISPAFAVYGAIAFDEGTGRYGFAWNEQTQHRAEEIALKDCQSGGCKIVVPVGPRECAALASAEKGTAWGAAKRPSADAAKLNAMENCQKRSGAGKCVLRGNECNR